MSVLTALLLGLVQGATEFLPISSSGHLTVVPFVLGLDEPSVAFDVAVHFGTLVAVVYVFRAQLAQLVQSVRRRHDAPENDKVLIRLLAIGTVPAAVVGGVFGSAVEGAFDRPVLVSFLLGVTGYMLFSAEHWMERREEAARVGEDLGSKDAVVIGLAQAFAILPGISRSGSTIAAAMRMGVARGVAARFSFLLSVPIILGATVVKIPDFVDAGLAGEAPAFLVGTVAAGISGVFAIRWFLSIIERRGLRPFGTYCFLAMIAGLLTGLARA